MQITHFLWMKWTTCRATANKLTVPYYTPRSVGGSLGYGYQGRPVMNPGGDPSFSYPDPQRKEYGIIIYCSTTVARRRDLKIPITFLEEDNLLMVAAGRFQCQ